MGEIDHRPTVVVEDPRLVLESHTKVVGNVALQVALREVGNQPERSVQSDVARIGRSPHVEVDLAFGRQSLCHLASLHKT